MTRRGITVTVRQVATATHISHNQLHATYDAAMTPPSEARHHAHARTWYVPISIQSQRRPTTHRSPISGARQNPRFNDMCAFRTHSRAVREGVPTPLPPPDYTLLRLIPTAAGPCYRSASQTPPPAHAQENMNTNGAARPHSLDTLVCFNSRPDYSRPWCACVCVFGTVLVLNLPLYASLPTGYSVRAGLVCVAPRYTVRPSRPRFPLRYTFRAHACLRDNRPIARDRAPLSTFPHIVAK